MIGCERGGKGTHCGLASSGGGVARVVVVRSETVAVWESRTNRRNLLGQVKLYDAIGMAR